MDSPARSAITTTVTPESKYPRNSAHVIPNTSATISSSTVPAMRYGGSFGSFSGPSSAASTWLASGTVIIGQVHHSARLLAFSPHCDADGVGR